MAALLRSRSDVAIRCQRTFTTTARRGVNLQLDYNDPELVKDLVPEYPHGSPQWYKQSRLGLYGGQRIQFGNNVGEKFGVKTRRTWHPNVKTKKLWSNALNGSVQLRVTTRVLRTIDKLGGLDEYLLGEKTARIEELGETGWWLRWAIMQTPAVKRRFAKQREELGLPPDTVSGIITPTQTATEIATATATTESSLSTSPAAAAPAFSHPRIRFRTGRRKHLTLTADGWRRARPYNVAAKNYRDWVRSAALLRFRKTISPRLYRGMTRKERLEGSQKHVAEVEKSPQAEQIRQRVIENHGDAFKTRRSVKMVKAAAVKKAAVAAKKALKKRALKQKALMKQALREKQTMV